MTDETVKDLVGRVEAHCAARGQSLTAFGRAVMNDPNVIFDIRAGRRSPTLKTLRRIEAALSAPHPPGNEPDGAAAA